MSPRRKAKPYHACHPTDDAQPSGLGCTKPSLGAPGLQNTRLARGGVKTRGFVLSNRNGLASNKRPVGDETSDRDGDGDEDEDEGGDGYGTGTASCRRTSRTQSIQRSTTDARNGLGRGRELSSSKHTRDPPLIGQRAPLRRRTARLVANRSRPQQQNATSQAGLIYPRVTLRKTGKVMIDRGLFVFLRYNVCTLRTDIVVVLRPKEPASPSQHFGGGLPACSVA